MEDEIRPDVVQAIRLAKKGSIDVCLVSGDQLETAVQFAIKANIITKVNENCEPTRKSDAITAEEFRKNGGVFFENTTTISDINQFKDLVRPEHIHHGKI
jgi:cation transport ATPase